MPTKKKYIKYSYLLDYLNLKRPDKLMAINRSNELGYSIKEINAALNLKRKIYEGIDQSTSFFTGKIQSQLTWRALWLTVPFACLVTWANNISFLRLHSFRVFWNIFFLSEIKIWQHLEERSAQRLILIWSHCRYLWSKQPPISIWNSFVLL